MTDDIKITGGADPEIAAAIAAVVDQAIREERASDTGSQTMLGRSAWARARNFRERPTVRPNPALEGEAPGPPPAPG